ncbi:MAG: hypothetical protein U5L08_07585 [Xanthomonadales bacterium]|nr:hypothetical protein [Xanthomonadales bacterium]
MQKDRNHKVDYLTTEQLAERIHYDARTIRSQLKDRVLIEGIHYIRPFGGRKILFVWQVIERDMVKHSEKACPIAASARPVARSHG